MIKKTALFVAIILASVICSNGQKITNFAAQQQFILSDTVNKLVYDYASGNVLYASNAGVGTWSQNTLANVADDFSTYNDISVAVNDIFISQSANKQYFAGPNGLIVFQNGEEIENTLNANIKHIVVSSDETVWFTTPSNAVVKYKNGVSTAIRDDYGFSRGVTALFIDRSDNVWVLCNENVVEFCANGKVKVFAEEFDNQFVYCIYQRANGDIIVGTNTGIKSYNYRTWTNLVSLDISPIALTENYQNEIIYSNYTGIYAFNGSESRLLNSNIVATSMLVSPYDGKICCNNFGSGLVCLDNSGKAETFHSYKSLLPQEIRILTNDESGNIFIAGNKGVNVVDDFAWYSHIVNNQVTAVCKSGSTLWIGTENSLIRKQNLNATQLLETGIVAICKGNDNTIYAASEEKIYTIEAGNVTNTTQIPQAYQPIKDIIYNNGLWLSSADGSIMNAFAETPAVPTQYQDFVQFMNVGETTYLVCENAVRSFVPTEMLNDIADAAVTTIDYVSGRSILSATVCDNELYFLDNATSDVNITMYDNNLGNFVSLQNFNNMPLIYPHRYTKIASSGNSTLWALAENNSIDKIQVKRLADNNLANCLSVVPGNCYSSNTASITINESNFGVSGSQAFSIDNGKTWQNDNTFSNLESGYKHVVVKYNDSNIGILDTIIFVPMGEFSSAKLSYVQPECTGDKGKIELVDYGSANFVWETASITSSVREELDAGDYAVTVNAATCPQIFSVNLIEPTSIEITPQITNLSCYSSNNGQISLLIEGGISPYTFHWNNAASTNAITSLSAGDYTCTVSDKHLCEDVVSVNVSQPDSLLVAVQKVDITCNGLANGEIELSISGGTADYTVLWHDGNENLLLRENLTAGNYTITVTDANSCTKVQNYVITEPEVLNINLASATQNRCFGDELASISVNVSGGTSDYQFQWQRNEQAFAETQNLQNLQAGNYSLTVSDANLCQATFSHTINSIEELVAQPVLTPISCNGYNDGILSGTASGGSGTYAQYFWFNAENPNTPICVTADFENVGAGDYLLVVKDSRNCTDTVAITVTEPTGFSYTTNTTDASCNGNNNGTITIQVDGALSDYSFAWSEEISTTNRAENLTAGIYTVSITEINSGCIKEIVDTVSEPAMTQLNLFDEIPLCYGSTTTITPGVFSSYIWSNDSTSDRLTIDSEGDYSVTVTDFDNCRYFAVGTALFRETNNDNHLKLATVNQDNSVNLYWTKLPNLGITQYKIYRSEGEEFSQIGTVNYSAIATFKDSTKNAAEQSYNYKVVAVNDCGDEGQTEDFHNTINLQVSCENGVCNLLWTNYLGASSTFYYILAGNTIENLQVIDSTLFSNNDFSLPMSSDSVTYYRIMLKLDENCNPGDGQNYNTIYSNMAVYRQITTNITKFEDVNITAFPNPFNEEICIEIANSALQNASYEIVNSLGQIIETQQITTNIVTLGKNLDAGVYYVNVRLGNLVKVLKISKID